MQLVDPGVDGWSVINDQWPRGGRAFDQSLKFGWSNSDNWSERDKFGWSQQIAPPLSYSVSPYTPLYCFMCSYTLSPNPPKCYCNILGMQKNDTKKEVLDFDEETGNLTVVSLGLPLVPPPIQTLLPGAQKWSAFLWCTCTITITIEIQIQI